TSPHFIISQAIIAFLVGKRPMPCTSHSIVSSLPKHHLFAPLCTLNTTIVFDRARAF
ncbi:hypothetical protein D018_0203B, partial [Vibrio parahaemolyticus VP2007-007]